MGLDSRIIGRLESRCLRPLSSNRRSPSVDRTPHTASTNADLNADRIWYMGGHRNICAILGVALVSRISIARRIRSLISRAQ